MNKERAMELMGGIDPALVEGADLPMPAKRRIPKITRVILVAACLCLALAGTAGAVSMIAGFHRMELEHHITFPFDTIYEQYDGYTLWSDLKRIPLDAFSDEILELARQNPAKSVKIPVFGITQLGLRTGLDFPALPTHDALRLNGFTAWLAAEQNGLPSGIDYYQNYMGVGAGNRTLKLSLQAAYFTEATPVDDPWVTILFPEGHTAESEEYTTENGLSVVLFTFQVPEDLWETDITVKLDGTTSYQAVFMLDGVRYIVEANCPESPDRALTVLKEFLENFIPS